MARPQQRAPRNRRTLSPNTPPQRGDLWPASITFSGTEVTILLEGPTDGAILNGIPPFLDADNGTHSIAAHLSGSILTLTLSSAPVPGQTHRLPPQDASLRSGTGGYLSAITWKVPVPPTVLSTTTPVGLPISTPVVVCTSASLEVFTLPPDPYFGGDWWVAILNQAAVGTAHEVTTSTGSPITVVPAGLWVVVTGQGELWSQVA